MLLPETIKTAARAFSLSLAVCLTSAVSGPSWAQPPDVGQTAVNKESDNKDADKQNPYADALKKWQPLAEQGDAEAQYILGMAYLKGKGIKNF